jgi:hypothetical protein
MARFLSGLPGLDAGDAVAAELQLWASAPFDPRRANCGLSVAAYVARATGQRVPAWLTLIGWFGVGRLTRDARAFGRVAARAMAELGCRDTSDIQRGDVALVDLPGGVTAAICTRAAAVAGDGPLWAARGDGAVVIGRAEGVVRAWRLPCPRQ